jgi:hypothetical protein
MNTYKSKILFNLLNGDAFLSIAQQKMHDKIAEAVNYSWNNWDANIIATYHPGVEKPEHPTKEFVENWIENEPFSEDGFDEDRLIELFG